MRRLVIGGTHSGCGKTTVTCAILAALKARNMSVSSFKCGPDYIDPMFHREVIGTASYNLDSFFCNDNTLRYLLAMNSSNADISVIEGVMGFYDGVDGRGSAHSVSEITESPTVLVIDCKGMSESIGAIMKGYLTYRNQNKIIGFIFNRLPQRLIPKIKNLCTELGTRYFGCIPQNSFVIESRRLGLVTAAEIADIKSRLEQLGCLAEQNILLDELIEASDAPKLVYDEPKTNIICYDRRPKIAVTRDNAFCFIYSDNIALLEKLGCDIEYFSPLEDASLPVDCCGLILSGGYPELYAEKLAANRSMLNSINKAVLSGIPTIAECGGFMYLHKNLVVKDGSKYKMVGVIDGDVYETDKLQRFGYVTLTSRENSLICGKSDNVAAHEFHYWDSTSCGSDFVARKSDGREWECVHADKSLYAGFPHLYFWSDTRMAERFVSACAGFGGLNEQDK